MAIKNRPVIQPLIFHSDLGIQYACDEFRQELGAYPLIRQSMSRKANCRDNAVAESFFKTLKGECVYDYKFADQQEAATTVFEYIEIWYNRKRIHGSGHPVFSGLQNTSPDGAIFKSICFSCLIYCPKFCCKSTFGSPLPWA